VPEQLSEERMSPTGIPNTTRERWPSVQQLSRFTFIAKLGDGPLARWPPRRTPSPPLSQLRKDNRIDYLHATRRRASLRIQDSTAGISNADSKSTSAALESSSAQFAHQPGPCKFLVAHDTLWGDLENLSALHRCTTPCRRTRGDYRSSLCRVGRRRAANVARFLHPLIEPDVRFSRIRLYDHLLPAACAAALPSGSPCLPSGTADIGHVGSDTPTVS
jgi:hypothetical protein